MRIVVFDFDGTITKKDTLLEFIKHSKGKVAFYFGFLIYSPLLVLMQLNLYPNWKVKQQIFAHFYKGLKHQKFSQMCKIFFEDNRHLIFQQAEDAIKAHKNAGDTVVIITASLVDWVKYFAEWLGVKEIIGTEIEIENNQITGGFKTKNCYGQEKVDRLLEKYPNRNDYELIVYGDSKGDKEMLKFADKAYYKVFLK